MVPQERRNSHLLPALLRFVTRISGDSGLSYRLEDSRTGKTRVELVHAPRLWSSSAPSQHAIAVGGEPCVLQTTGLSAQLTCQSARCHIDYVKSLSGPTRIEWVLRDSAGAPAGVMRLNRTVGWLEIVLADNQMVCKTAISPHHGGIEEIVVRTDRLAPKAEPLFLVAVLYGLVVALSLPASGV